MAEEDEGSTGSPELEQVARSMVVIRKMKSEFSVFPPTNHENLQVPSRLFKEEDEEEEEGRNTPSSFSSDLLSSPSGSSITSSSSTSSFPPSEDGDGVGLEASRSTVQAREGGHLGGWWGIGFGVLRSKAWGVVGWPFGCRNAVGARAFRSVVFPAAAAVMWLLFWRLRLWRWWSRRGGKVDARLPGLVKEKDQKIAQLLNQIAQMNELLISRQRA